MTRYKVYTKEKGLIETNDCNYASDLNWHRLDGPANIWYNIHGIIDFVSYYINGVKYTEENYHKELLKLKLQAL